MADDRYGYGELKKELRETGDELEVIKAEVPGRIKRALEQIRGDQTWPKFFESLVERLSSQGQ